MGRNEHRRLKAPLFVVTPRHRFTIPPGFVSIYYYAAGTNRWFVGVDNMIPTKGTSIFQKMTFYSEDTAAAQVSAILAQIDSTYVDTREVLERDAQPILEFLSTNPSDPAALAAVMNSPERINAGAYLLARSLGHIKGPISYIGWYWFGARAGSTRPDCWEVRTVSVKAETNSNVGTPMHRYGGDPTCSESILPMWMPVAPSDPARAIAEAMLYDGGPEAIINGYDYYPLNAKRRAEFKKAS